MRCCLRGCPSGGKREPKGTVRFHKFPSDPEFFKKWVDWVTEENKKWTGGKDWKFYKSASVCSRHFDASTYINNQPKFRSVPNVPVPRPDPVKNISKISLCGPVSDSQNEVKEPHLSGREDPIFIQPSTNDKPMPQKKNSMSTSDTSAVPEDNEISVQSDIDCSVLGTFSDTEGASSGNESTSGSGKPAQKIIRNLMQAFPSPQASNATSFKFDVGDEPSPKRARVKTMLPYPTSQTSAASSFESSTSQSIRAPGEFSIPYSSKHSTQQAVATLKGQRFCPLCGHETNQFIPKKIAHGISVDEARETQSILRQEKRIRYPGDMDETDFDSPNRAKRCYRILLDANTSSDKRLHAAQKKVKRLETKLANFEDLVDELQNNHHISAKVRDLMEVSWLVGSIGGQLFE